MDNRNMIAPLVRPYITYEDLCLLPSDGNRYELFDGEAYVSPSPSHQHQDLVLSLAIDFKQAIQDRSRVFVAPLDVVLDRATAVQPDLVLVLERNLGILQGVIRGVPDLVVEVLSASTAAMDRGLKMETYARYEVGEYWIVDGDRATVEIYRLDAEAGAYRLSATCRSGDQARTPLLPLLSVDIAALFVA
jgi:Uma2 family endonuclease